MCSCAMIPSAAATSGVRDYGLDNRLRRALCPTRFRRGKPIGGISSCCRARHLYAVGLVALRRVAPRRAAQRLAGTAHSVRSTRTGLSQRDKLHQTLARRTPEGESSLLFFASLDAQTEFLLLGDVGSAREILGAGRSEPAPLRSGQSFALDPNQGQPKHLTLEGVTRRNRFDDTGILREGVGRLEGLMFLLVEQFVGGGLEGRQPDSPRRIAANVLKTAKLLGDVALAGARGR